MSDTVFDPRLVHPLDDAPEPKLFRPELGRLAMTGRVRAALLGVQLYLGTMAGLVLWRALSLAGLF
jgi:hypothetical protein